MSLTHRRNFEYDTSKEIRPGPPKPGDVRRQKILSSQRASIELIRSVIGEIEFSTANHLQAVKEEMSEGNKSWYDVNDEKL